MHCLGQILPNNKILNLSRLRVLVFAFGKMNVTYPFPKLQILDSSKQKEIADDNFKVDENSRKFSKSLENTVEKGDLNCKHIKTRACLGKG